MEPLVVPLWRQNQLRLQLRDLREQQQQEEREREREREQQIASPTAAFCTPPASLRFRPIADGTPNSPPPRYARPPPWRHAYAATVPNPVAAAADRWAAMLAAPLPDGNEQPWLHRPLPTSQQFLFPAFPSRNVEAEVLEQEGQEEEAGGNARAARKRRKVGGLCCAWNLSPVL